MDFKLAGIAGLLSGVQILLLLRILDLPPWLVASLLFSINLAVIALVTRWTAAKPGPKVDPVGVFDPTLQIAQATLPYIRQGLNPETALKTAEIIQRISEVPAVAITDKERVLAYLGVGCEKHHPGDRILTEATRQVLYSGQMKVVQTTQELNCSVKNCECPLAAAVIVPLKCRDEVIGSLKLYQTQDGQLPPQVIRLAVGIAQLLSMQTELAELDRQTQLVTVAQLNALHAQINPHFFFNTLNTIIMYSRTNPQRARRLLIHLADFFRQTLKRHGPFVTLKEELECVHTYLVLEKARFGRKLHIIQDIDEELLDFKVPVLSLQPLVENAVKHGISPKTESGAVRIAARLDRDELLFSVSDDGVGIPAEKLPLVLQPGYGSGNGVGLSNVHQRLIGLFGNGYGLHLSSWEGKGTTVVFRVPLKISETQKEREVL